MPADIEFNPFGMKKGTAPAGIGTELDFSGSELCFYSPLEQLFSMPGNEMNSSSRVERWISNLEVPSSVPVAHWNSFLLHTEGN